HRPEQGSPGRNRGAWHAGGCARGGERDLRGDRQAHTQAADPRLKASPPGGRRRALAALLALLVVAPRAPAQPNLNPAPGIDARTINTPEGALRSIVNGAPMRRGRVQLELPKVAENGHSVGMTVRVDSPMTEADHVRQIDLIADRNPIPRVATF